MMKPGRQLDISDMWMTHDNNYLYVKWQRTADFLSYFWYHGTASDYGAYFSSSPAALDNWNLCAGKIITSPADFDEDMVLNFDTNRDGYYDYYLTVNTTYPQAAVADYAQSVKFYKDDGNGQFSRNSDILKHTFRSGEYKISRDAAVAFGSFPEYLKVNMEKILRNSNLSWNGSNYARYSYEDYTTSRADYALSAAPKIKLKANAKKRVKKSTAAIIGTTLAGTTIEVVVNGVKQAEFQTTKKKFKTNVSLDLGSNEVWIGATKAASGTKYLTKTVRRTK